MGKTTNFMQLYFSASFCTIFVYSRIPLSSGSVLAVSEYIFVAVLSRLILNEKINLRKFIDLSIIVVIIVYFI